MNELTIDEIKRLQIELETIRAGLSVALDVSFDYPDLKDAKLVGEFVAMRLNTLREIIKKQKKTISLWKEWGQKKVAELEAAKKNDCHWIPAGNEGNNWESGCVVELWFFETGGPKENGMKFCPFCGGTLVEDFPADEDEEEPNE